MKSWKMKIEGSKRISVRKCFSLVELLVVIAIIAILAAMLMPALSGAKEMSKQAVCMNNQRTIMTAYNSYADDFAEYFPPISSKTLNDMGNGGSIYCGFGMGMLGNEGYLPLKNEIFNCPARSQIWVKNGVSSAIRYSGYVFLYPLPSSNSIQSYRRSEAFKNKMSYSGGSYWLKTPLSCTVGSTIIGQDVKNLPHGGRGVVTADYDLSSRFFVRNIYTWPGYSWSASTPTGNATEGVNCLIWKTLNGQ
jgi:prepilin-type N-terminal cleavage/methylation domain-containing protein